MKSQIDLYGEANEARAQLSEYEDTYRAKFLKDGLPVQGLSAEDEKLRKDGVKLIKATRQRVTELMDAAALAPKEMVQLKAGKDLVESSPLLRYMRDGKATLSADEIKDYVAGNEQRDSFRPTAMQLNDVREAAQGFFTVLTAEGREMRLARTSPARADLPTGIHQVITETDVSRTLRYFGGVKEACSFRSVSDGSERLVPALSSHTQTGRRLTAEGTDATKTDLPAYTHVAVKPFTYSSDLMEFSLEYLQDAVIDVTQDVMIELPRRIGRIQNTEFTNTATAGAANTKPEGLATGAGELLNFATNTALVWDDLERARDALDISYLMGRETNMGLGYSPGVKGMVGWMMHQNAWSAIRRLQDTQRRPLILQEAQSGIAGLFPNTLLGYPVIINNDLPDTSANTVNRTFALFGDFGMYRCTEVGDSFTILRLYGDTYAARNNVAFTAFHRATGNYVGPTEAVVNLRR